MKNLFPGYYRPADDELARLWREGLVIIDANVLLNLYRYPERARRDLLAVLEGLGDRLWIPHQAALEFQMNRLNVIAEQVDRFKELDELCESTLKTLKDKIEQLQLTKRHSRINPQQFIGHVETAVTDFREELQTFRAGQPDVYSDDPIRERLNTLLAGRVGPAFPSQAEVDRIEQEGKTRYERHWPPGYADVAKGSKGKAPEQVVSHDKIVIDRKYGDLIMWHQIIEEAKKRQAGELLFITDDEKEDWRREYAFSTCIMRKDSSITLNSFLGQGSTRHQSKRYKEVRRRCGLRPRQKRGIAFRGASTRFWLCGRPWVRTVEDSVRRYPS